MRKSRTGAFLLLPLLMVGHSIFELAAFCTFRAFSVELAALEGIIIIFVGRMFEACNKTITIVAEHQALRNSCTNAQDDRQQNAFGC